MNSWQRAFVLFSAPGRQMEGVAARPSFWLPLVLTLLGAAAVQLWYFQIVDSAWVVDYTISSNRNMARMPDAQRAQLAARMSKSSLMWIGVVSAVLGPLVWRTLTATFFNLLGKLLNIRRSFGDWFAVVWWASLPLVLNLVAAMLFLALSRSRQFTPFVPFVLSLNELFGHRGLRDVGFSLLSTLTLLHPLAWWYLVRGTQALSGRSLAFSATFTLVPILLFYGVWALLPL
jgi:hypothetical protein